MPTVRWASHWGFASWNDFFTRRFKDGERPVASPDDDTVIVSACESTPYGISTDVQRQPRPLPSSPRDRRRSLAQPRRDAWPANGDPRWRSASTDGYRHGGGSLI